MNKLHRVIFLISLPMFMISLLLPIYGREIGASVVEIGLFFTAFSLMTVILRPLVGWGLDRLGRKPFLLLGVAAYIAAMLGFAFIDRIWGVMVARVCQGVASSFVWLSAYAMAADISAPDERAQSFGRLSQSNAWGSILGATVGFTIIITYYRFNEEGSQLAGWPLLFLFYAAANLVALLIAWRGTPETCPPIVHTARQPIRWGRNWILLLTVTLVTGASWAMVSPVLIIFLQEHFQVGVDIISWAFLPSGLVWALLPARLGKLADRFGRKPLMLLGMVMASASSFIVPHLGSILAFAALWGFQALCYAAGDPAEQALVADLTGGDQRGRAYGFYAMAADLGAALGPFAGTWLYQTLGASMPFYANGIVLALSALALFFLLGEPAQRQPVQDGSKG